MKKILKGIIFIVLNLFALIIYWFVPIFLAFTLQDATLFYASYVFMWGGFFLHVLFYTYLWPEYKYIRSKKVVDWLGNETNKEIDYEIFKDDLISGKTLIEKLEFVKQKIDLYAGEDLTKLRLLQAVLKTKNKINIKQILRNTLVPLSFSTIIFICSNENTNYIFLPDISLNKMGLNSSVIEMIKLLLFLIIVFILIIILLLQFTKSEKRNVLLEEIIEVCIKENEK